MEKYKANKNNSEAEVEEKSQDEINAENNANNIRNGADAAIASKNLYAAAAGYAVKGIDKITNGKGIDKMGETMNKFNKFSPGGKQLQNVSNKVNESGASDAIGSVARAKNNMSGQGNSSSKMNFSNKSSFLSSDSGKGNGFDLSNIKIPKSLKIKLIIGAAIALLSIVIFSAIVMAADDILNLGLTNGSVMTSTNGSFNSDVGSTMLNGSNTTMLSAGETLLTRIGQGKIDLINSQIKSDVDRAGRGTGAGVATAAYDFIKLLMDNGVNMTYTYGGEHGIVKEGLQSSWGYGNGLDCSSFVSWAMYNGGCENHTTAVVSGVQATYGVETTPELLKAGDIVANDEHVMMIISNSGSSVIVAHASSPTNGIIFSEKNYNDLSVYSLRDMSSYYQQNCSR